MIRASLQGSVASGQKKVYNLKRLYEEKGHPQVCCHVQGFRKSDYGPCSL